jgi:ribulose-5-phosphate 4-epimerase/fuculose-1-phosphate aldolase
LQVSDPCNSTYGKAFSVFGRELDMMTQDSLRFYKSHAVYPNFGGVVLDREEGRKIAECLGDGKAAILQNHGLITVCCAYTTDIDVLLRCAIG